MKPTVQLAAARTPDGHELTLCQHDQDFALLVDRQELMSSRRHESELALARLGCERVAAHRNPVVLIGGLGMGYTLRAALDLLQPQARVVVVELLPAVVEWNRKYFGRLTGHPLRDPRVELQVADVYDVIRNSPASFDVILLDVDNGPHAMTLDHNHRLYGKTGLTTIVDALHQRGCLAVWSATRDTRFENRLHHLQLHVKTYCVAAHAGARSRPHRIWVASRDRHSLPETPAAPERKPRPVSPNRMAGPGRHPGRRPPRRQP